MRQVCVIGLGQFGMHLARTLVRLDCEVLAIDENEERVDQVRDAVHRALVGDARNYQMLSSVISDTIDEVVVALGERDIAPSILCTLNIKKIGVSQVLATARDDDHAQILKAVGAKEIIFPERDTAERTARRIANPNLHDMFALDAEYRIMEITAPADTVGKSLMELDLRSKHGLLVLGIRPSGATEFNYLPEAGSRVKAEDILMVMGREMDLAQFSGPR